MTNYLKLLIRALDGRGDVSSFLGKYDEAIESFQQMANHGRDSRVTLAKSQRKMASIYQYLGEYDVALKTLLQAEKLLDGHSLEEQLEKAEIHVSRCWIYRIKGEVEKGIKEGETGLAVVQELSPVFTPERTVLASERGWGNRITRIKAIAFNNLGVIFYNKGEYNNAIKLYKRHLKISEELGNKRGIGIASCNLGNIYREKGEYDKAIELHQKDLKISREIGDKRGISEACCNLATTYQARGEYGKATELFQTDLKISEELGDRHNLGIACCNLGATYQAKGEYDKAIELFRKDVKIFEKIGNKQGVGVVCCNLGAIFLELGEFKKAKKFLSRSEETLKGIGDKNNLIETFANIAELKIKMAEDRWQIIAGRYMDSALKLACELDLMDRIALCYLGYGRVYTKTKDFKNAEKNYKKAIGIFEELKQPYEMAKAYYFYAEYLVSQNKYKPAKEYLERSENFFRKIRNLVFAERIGQLQKEIKDF